MLTAESRLRRRSSGCSSSPRVRRLPPHDVLLAILRPLMHLGPTCEICYRQCHPARLIPKDGMLHPYLAVPLSCCHPDLFPVLELTHNHGTEDDDSFQAHSGNSEPKGYGHIGLSGERQQTRAADRIVDMLEFKPIIQSNDPAVENSLHACSAGCARCMQEI